MVVQYLVRNRMGAAIGLAGSAPLPATVGEIIERQRAFRDEAAQRERAQQEAERQAAEEARLAAERRRAETEALRASLPGTVTELSVVEADYRARRYRDEFRFRVRVTNAGTRPVRGVRGRFVFVDTFGHDVGAAIVGVDEDIAPGATFEAVFTRDFNQFLDEDRALRGFDLARGTVRWEPQHVVYADGTSVEIAP